MATLTTTVVTDAISTTTIPQQPPPQITLEDIQHMYPHYHIDDIRTYKILSPGNNCGYVYMHVDHPVLDHLMEYGINGVPFHLVQHKVLDTSWYKLQMDLVESTARKIWNRHSNTALGKHSREDL